GPGVPAPGRLAELLSLHVLRCLAHALAHGAPVHASAAIPGALVPGLGAAGPMGGALAVALAKRRPAGTPRRSRQQRNGFVPGAACRPLWLGTQPPGDSDPGGPRAKRAVPRAARLAFDPHPVEHLGHDGPVGLVRLEVDQSAPCGAEGAAGLWGV